MKFIIMWVALLLLMGCEKHPIMFVIDCEQGRIMCVGNDIYNEDICLIEANKKCSVEMINVIMKNFGEVNE